MGSMMMDQTPYTMRTDPRTGYQMATEQRRISAGDDWAEQYQRSLSDPSYAIASPALQQMQEQELTDQAFNRMGNAGAGASGSAKALAQKALVDYRLGLIQQQNAARENLRQNMVQLYGENSPSYNVQGVQGSPSPMTRAEMTMGQMASNMGGSMGGMMAGI
jgi:hypothetical protein